MKKQLLAAMAATAVLGVTTVFAANPFSDVTPQDWAYQSVSQLAAAGVINGYPDGTFRGQNNITRFEMAQMVAKAMANQNRANAEQQAMINRLADEFSAELNNLGVRVGNLERKVGNVKVTGDARLRYTGRETNTIVAPFGLEKESKFDYRGRIQFNATVNDSTNAVVRVTTGDTEFGDASTGSKVTFDRMYVNHKFGEKTDLTVGRYGEVIGGGLMYDDAFDGAKLAFGGEKVNASVSYGSMVGGYFGDATAAQNPTVVVAQLQGKLGQKTTIGGFYLWGDKALDTDIYGFNLNSKLGEKVWIGGEWLKANDVDHSTAWTAGIGYGNYDQAVKGTWDVKAQYFNQEEMSPIFSSTWSQPYDYTNSRVAKDATHDYVLGYKGWEVSANYALAKNVGLSAYYAFDSKTHAGQDLDDAYRVELNYQF